MPKLRESDKQTKDRLFQSLVDGKMKLVGIENKKELAKKIFTGQRSFYYKYNDPDKFTAFELRRIFSVLRFTDEEKGSVM